MTDGQTEACEANEPHPGRSQEWLDGYRAGWDACKKWFIPNQVEPLMREIRTLQEQILYTNRGGPMLTSFVRNYVVPIVFRDVNHRLDSERKFYENSFKLLKDEIQTVKSQVNSLVHLKNAQEKRLDNICNELDAIPKDTQQSSRLDEHAKRMARLTLDMDNMSNRVQRLEYSGRQVMKAMQGL